MVIAITAAATSRSEITRRLRHRFLEQFPPATSPPGQYSGIIEENEI
jgi:hypothetical protein